MEVCPNGFYLNHPGFWDILPSWFQNAIARTAVQLIVFPFEGIVFGVLLNVGKSLVIKDKKFPIIALPQFAIKPSPTIQFNPTYIFLPGPSSKLMHHNR